MVEIRAITKDSEEDLRLKNGFVMGGFDNRVYRGTSQADKADVFFYLDG